MAIPRRGIQDIRTLTGRVRKATIPHEAYLRISHIEMEKARKTVESEKARQLMADIAARHPKVKFLCFVASRHANQSLCTLCRELPNLALAGYWWHNFFPGAIRQIMEERLDMLPAKRGVR